jgi:glycosyltransferase 2 family protein
VRKLQRWIQKPWTRGGLVIAFIAGVGALLWWHGPHWADFKDAFTSVQWEWVAVAVGLNLLSIVARSFAWDAVIRSAMPPPFPRFRLVFTAFCVGLLANVVVPGRVGELARVAVLNRRLDGRRRGLWPTLVGTVFAHRVFDLVPVVMLVVFVLVTADIPGWAFTSLIIVLAAGVGLFLFAFASARHHGKTRIEGMGSVRRIVTMARLGLGVMRSPGAAALAIFGQCVGWALQLLAVWSAMRAFDIHEGLPAAAVVLLLMNVATIIPLWPGNVGLVQVAVATPLVRYGVDYGKGVAFGFGLQAIEASVGIGVGLIFLGREGLSFARLREMPGAVSADEPEGDEDVSPAVPGEATEHEPERARVPG